MIRCFFKLECGAAEHDGVAKLEILSHAGAQSPTVVLHLVSGVEYSEFIDDSRRFCLGSDAYRAAAHCWVVDHHVTWIMKRAITAILKNDIYELKNAFLSFGKPTEKIDHASLYTDLDDMVGKYMNMDFGTMDLGELMEDAIGLLKKHKIAIEPDITLLARSMVTMEGTLKLCSPEVNMIQILTSYMSANMFHEIDIKKEIRHALRDIYGSSKKSLEIPAQVSDLLNITKNGQVRVNIESAQIEKAGRELKKGFDHLLLVLIVMALWFSSAILCLSDVTPRVLGMPYLSVAGFISGFLIVLYVLIHMLIQRKK